MVALCIFDRINMLFGVKSVQHIFSALAKINSQMGSLVIFSYINKTRICTVIRVKMCLLILAVKQ